MEPIENASQIQAQTQSSGGLTAKAQFVAKYWFNTLQMVTVVNPLPEDWPFMVEMRHYIIKAGAKERFPGVIANVYLDQMSKILAQHDENLGNMADPELKKIYYNRLIVSVDSLVQEHDNRPDYLANVSPAAILPTPDDSVAPWEQASSVPPVTQDVAPALEPKPAPVAPKEPVTKEFDLDGMTYRMIVNKNDKEMYYKDGRLTSAAEYARAASMA